MLKNRLHLEPLPPPRSHPQQTHAENDLCGEGDQE